MNENTLWYGNNNSTDQWMIRWVVSGEYVEIIGSKHFSWKPNALVVKRIKLEKIFKPKEEGKGLRIQTDRGNRRRGCLTRWSWFWCGRVSKNKTYILNIFNLLIVLEIFKTVIWLVFISIYFLKKNTFCRSCSIISLCIVWCSLLFWKTNQ